MTAYDAMSQSMFAQTRAGFIAAGADSVTATNRTYAALFGTLWRQAPVHKSSATLSNETREVASPTAL